MAKTQSPVNPAITAFIVLGMGGLSTITSLFFLHPEVPLTTMLGLILGGAFDIIFGLASGILAAMIIAVAKRRNKVIQNTHLVILGVLLGCIVAPILWVMVR